MDQEQTMEELGKLLHRINKQMPACAFATLDFEREEESGKYRLESANIPEEYLGDTSVFSQRIDAEVLRFGSKDFLNLHFHRAAASAVMVPGSSEVDQWMLSLIIGDDKKAFHPNRCVPQFIHPGVPHALKRGTEKYGEVYVISVSAPVIGNDVVWL